MQHTLPQTQSSKYTKRGQEAEWGALISVGKGRCGASHAPSYFQSLESGSATKKAITELKAHLRILTARWGRWPGLSRSEKPLVESQNLGWKELLEVIGFIQLLRPDCPGVLPSLVLNNSTDVHYVISVPHSSLTALAMQLFFTPNWNLLCCNLCLRQLKAAIGSPPG